MRLQFDDEDENLGGKALHHTEMIAETTAIELNSYTRKKRRTKNKKSEKNQQKRTIKKQYADTYKQDPGSVYVSYGTSISAKDSSASSKIRRRLFSFTKRTKPAFVIVGVIMVCFIVYLIMMTVMGSMIAETGGAVVESTYLSSDEDIYSVNEKYTQMENQLQSKVNGIEASYTGYDEYRYQVDEITHESYSLISYLTAMYGNFKAGDVEDDLEELFNLQYSMRVWDEVEMVTRTETKVGTRVVTDPETGEMITETYEYEDEVEEELRILNTQVTNKGLDAVAFQKLDEDGKRHYLIYQASLGNRSYLFGDRILIGNPAGGGIKYDIPPEALSDERFARMIREAEKYLGYPYVWGGSSPSTSFDCSGFVSWVVNNCGNGWSVGRLGCDGLMSHCTYVSPDNAKPGDLIFFQGTYNTTGSSHVGIYVGNGMMIHCGDPIQYTSIESSYWQQHFMCFGRMN